MFPDDVGQPDRDKVAVVTLEVMCLRLEVEMLIKVPVIEQRHRRIGS